MAPAVAWPRDTNGRRDRLAELCAPNLGQPAAVLEHTRLTKATGASETSIHLQSYRLS